LDENSNKLGHSVVDTGDPGDFDDSNCRWVGRCR
jgi:hypothetical protein